MRCAMGLSDAAKAQFHKDVLDDATRGAKPAAKPKAIILAGQPGSGKSGPTTRALKKFQETGEGAVVIDPDLARALHPDYAELMALDDKTAATKVHEEASEAAKAARRSATEQGFNVIIDGTLKSPESAAALVEELVAAGYEVEVVAMCVDPEVSWQGVQDRYEKQRAKTGSGRYVPKEVHDDAVDGMVESLEALEKQGLVSKIDVIDRDNQLLFSSSPVAEATAGVPSEPGEITKVFEDHGGRTPAAPPPPAAAASTSPAGGGGGGGGGGAGGGMPQARINDMHVCPMVTVLVPHVGGPIAIGCPTVLVGGMPAARVGDMAICTGPPDAIAKGSATVLIGGMPAARLGDLTIHGGAIVAGLPTVLTGG